MPTGVAVLLAVVVTATSPIGSAAAATPSWTATDLGTLGGPYSEANAINDDGLVVGSAYNPGYFVHAFVRTPGSSELMDIGTLQQGDESGATGVNASGQVVGASEIKHGDEDDNDAFIWTAADGMQAIDTPGLTTWGVPHINDAGQVIGNFEYDIENSNLHRAYAWTAQAGATEIPRLSAGDSEANAENSGGAVVGGSQVPGQGDNYHAFIWRPGDQTSEDLGTLGGNGSEAIAINDAGLVVGNITTASGYSRCFAWTQANGMVDLGTLGGHSCNATDVNDNGQIVGYSLLGDNQTTHPFITTVGNPLTDIGGPGAGNSQAQKINSNGRVIGYTADSNGSPVDAFTWTASDGVVDLNDSVDGANSSLADALNDQGQIVGQAYTSQDGVFAVLWQKSAGQPPSITSNNTTAVGLRQPFDFKITASGSPAPSLTEQGTLPSGVSFADNGDGTADLTGTPATGTAGSYPLTITAANGVGSNATQTFTLTVTNASSTPAVSSQASDTEPFGMPFSFTVTTTGNPAPKLTKSGALPAGVTWKDNGDGTATISGTPSNAAIGVYPLTITAKNIAGTANQAFSLAISRAPKITKIPNTSTQAGASLNIAITTKAYTTARIGESGALPNGISFRDNGDGTAVISGTPGTGSGGMYAITVTATNTSGTASQTFTLKVNERPTITSPNSASAAIGSPFNFQFAASGYPAPKYSLTGTLPKGISFKAATGTLTGTAKAKTAGTYMLTLTATNSVGTQTQTFALTVH